MMKAGYLNSDNYPLITEMTATKNIMNLNVCFTDNRKLNKFLVDKNVSHICSTDKDESKDIIADEYSIEEDKSECVHINRNKQKAQIMRHMMRNLQLQMKFRAILTYSNVVGIF